MTLHPANIPAPAATLTPAPTPTVETYAELQAAFDHFNRAIFDHRLPPCLITLQRYKRSYGYYSHERFVCGETGELTDEIAMNPAYFVARSIRDTLSTLVHEMAHQWQWHFGKPGRRGYHNHEWANFMEQIGLMPSNTGQPGGRRVGEQMTHFIIDNGLFDLACADLLTTEYTLSWFDRFPPIEPQAADPGDPSRKQALAAIHPVTTENKSNRVKYRCPSCSAQVWGKPDLKLNCGEEACGGVAFKPVGMEDTA
ncbi:SprT-like domain-containing protein [Thalassospira sp.]|uniref:SprT-like domain-containing protein n=1 Tax=Thalassospira sp. TaxID=1912094 RepID=UPI00273542F5|nr:SprT-like domain-containing protein [Thalassospira sp.]MDP2699889.1 SprT-like domain-containing protein [Thalassospira sp.]